MTDWLQGKRWVKVDTVQHLCPSKKGLPTVIAWHVQGSQCNVQGGNAGPTSSFPLLSPPISQSVWWSDHFTRPAIFRRQGHGRAAESIPKFSCQQWMLCLCPQLWSQCLSRCHGFYGYVTVLVYMHLRGRDRRMVPGCALHFHPSGHMHLDPLMFPCRIYPSSSVQ